MDEKINYDILNTIGIILSIVSAILSLSIYFTDTFWYVPGICIMILSIIISIVGIIYSYKTINIITLAVSVLSLIIFSSPLFLA